MDHKTRPNPEHLDEGEGARKYQGNANVDRPGKGHDLLNSDSFTSGTGSVVSSPSEAKKMDRTGVDDDKANDTER